MGETETPHFYDFGTFEWARFSQNQLFSLETPGYLNKSRNPRTILKNVIFTNLKVLETQHVDIFEQTGTGNDEGPSKKSWKAWIWDQYLSKNMEREIGNMDLISFKNITGFMNLWNQETKELRNQETKKPKTKKPRNQ